MVARILVLWQGEAFATDEGVLGFTDSTADIAFGKAVDGGQLELGMVMTQIAQGKQQLVCQAERMRPARLDLPAFCFCDDLQHLVKKDGRYACEPFEFAIASLDEVFVFHLGIGNLQDIFARGLLLSSCAHKMASAPAFVVWISVKIS